MKSLTQFSIIVGLSLLASLGSWLFSGSKMENKPFFCDRSKLKPDEICYQDITGNILWIDARSRAEWIKNGMKGSILWNLDPRENALQLEAEAVPFLLEAEKVIVYCSSQKCDTSRLVAEKIRKLELGNEVKILYGGWSALEKVVSIPR